MIICFECDADCTDIDSPFVEMGHCPYCGGPLETIEEETTAVILPFPLGGKEVPNKPRPGR